MCHNGKCLTPKKCLAEKRLDFLGHCIAFSKGAIAQVDILQKAQDPDAVELRGSVADLLRWPTGGPYRMHQAQRATSQECR
jgi:hypothetical protein